MKEIVTARDCWPTQTEFQMSSPRQKLAIEKQGSDNLFFSFFESFFRRPFSSESTDQSSAIRDYSEFAVFADQWRRTEDLLATHFDERSNRDIRFNDECRFPVSFGLVPRHVLGIHAKGRFEDLIRDGQ